MTRPPIFLLECAALACAFAAAAVPASRAADGAAAAGLLATAFLTALVPALAEWSAKTRSAAWRAAGRGERARQAFTDGSDEAGDADLLQAGDLIYVAAGETIPCDGTVIEGAATVDESALTGESAPVLRDAAAERARVIGGTRLLSDRLKIRIDGPPGGGLLGRLGTLLAGPLGRTAPREAIMAGAVLLASATFVIFHLNGAALPTALEERIAGAALATLLLPTALASFAGAAGSLGVRRLWLRGMIARDARAAEEAATTRVLLIEETAASTGRRRAVEFIPAPGIPESVLVDAAQLASLADESPEGRSVVALAQARGVRGRRIGDLQEARFIKPAPHTRVGGFEAVDLLYRKGPSAALAGFSGGYGPELASAIDRIQRTGGESITIAISGRALGVVNMREPEPLLSARLARLRARGVRLVLGARAASSAAQALAGELGVNELVVALSPEARAAAVEKEKASGGRTAASGDAFVDGAVLAAADVGLARGLRAAPAAEAAIFSLVDDPEKLVDAVLAVRAARRTRLLADAAALACDALKAATATWLIFRWVAVDPAASAFGVPMGAVLALTVAGLVPLLLLGVAAFSGLL